MNQVFRAAGKAETKLKHIRKSREDAIEATRAKWDAKEQALIDGLDIQVRAALRHTRIIVDSEGQGEAVQDHVDGAEVIGEPASEPETEEAAE